MDGIEFYRTMNTISDNASSLWIDADRRVTLKGKTRQHTKELYEKYNAELMATNAFLDSVKSACPPYMARCFMWYNSDRVLIARLVDDTMYRSIFGVDRHRLMLSVEWDDNPLDPILQDGIKQAVESANARLPVIRDRVWHYVEIAVKPLGLGVQQRNDGNIERALQILDANNYQ